VLLTGCLIPGLKTVNAVPVCCHHGVNLLVGLSASQPHRCTVLNHACAQQLCIDNLQEEAKKKSRAERFNLPKSKAELDKEAKAKAAALAAELAEKKRQRGERFGTLSEVHRVSSVAVFTQRCAYMLCGSGDEGYLRIEAWGGTANGDLLTNNTLACCHLQEDKAAQRAKRFAAASAGGAPAKSPAGNGAASTADDLQAKLKVMMCTVHSCYLYYDDTKVVASCRR
jgi:hypothetical protein